MDDLENTSYIMGGNSIANESVVPRSMSLHLLNEITNGFSEDQLIGRGGFGTVYKAVDENGETIAVKLLSSPMPDDDQFKRELSILASVNHPNIVHVVGFCDETRQELVEYNGHTVLAHYIRMALCMEYVCNGSLAKYLSDETNEHDWRTHYQIIKGVCVGLKCLHESNPPILHLDLKLDNILLDEEMKPKIADFGLSRLLRENRTQLTKRIIGTPGYMPPELIDHGEISNKFDIFSLGVVMMHIIAGPKCRSDSIDMSSNEFIDYVYGIWRNRLQASPFYAADRDLYYEQIKKCSEVALNCVEKNRHKRPGIRDIVNMLNETETMISFPPTNNQVTSADQMTPLMSGNIMLLDVHPLRLCFPFEPNKLICCPLHIRNITDHYVAFRCLPKTRERCLSKLWQLWDILPPRSARTYVVTVEKQEQQPPDMEIAAVIQSCVVPSNTNASKMEFACAIEETRARPYQVTLTADFSQVGDPTTSDEPIRPEIKMIQCVDDFGKVLSMDIHPEAPWILTGHSHGYVAIWNYETQEKVLAFNVTEEQGLLHLLNHRSCRTQIFASKFAQKDWFAVGDSCGYIHVHRYMPNGVLKILKAHSLSVKSLAIHSSKSLLLSSSGDGLIKLWNWEAGWECVGRYEARCSSIVVFSPRNDGTFASVSVNDGTVQIWRIYSSDRPLATLGCGHYEVFSADYFSTDGANLFIITGSVNGISHIWDLQTNTHIAELEGSNLLWEETAFHGTKVGSTDHCPPLLITSYHNVVSLFNSTNPRHEYKIEFNPVQVYGCVYINRTRSNDSKDRLAIAIDGGIAVMAISHEDVGL